MAQTMWQRVTASWPQFQGKTALEFLDSSRTVTYEELYEEVRRTAKGFIKFGIHKGQRVGIWLPNRLEWVVAELALSLIGAIVVPVNLRLRTRELEYVLRHADVSVLIMTREFLTNSQWERLCEIHPGFRETVDGELFVPALPSLRKIISVGGGDFGHPWEEVQIRGNRLDDEMLDQLEKDTSPHDPVLLFWTSGTTSQPKGVLHDHQALENVENFAEYIHLSEADWVLANKPWFYIAGNFWTMLMPLMTGSTIVVGNTFRAEEVLDAITMYPITTVMATPFALSEYLQLDKKTFQTKRNIPRCVIGGAAPSRDLLSSLKDLWITDEVVLVYGMTETQGYSIVNRFEAMDQIETQSVGIPLDGFDCKIVNPENGQLVKDGEIGELWIRGRVFRGYYKKSLSESFKDGGWFATGDLFTNVQGEFRIVGRLKDVIKVGGENVAAEEVEQVLLSHPMIAQAAVIGVPDQARGEVCAAFVEWNTTPIPDEELRDWCNKRMAPFKIPRYIEPIHGNDWPLTESKKIRKPALKERFLSVHHLV